MQNSSKQNLNAAYVLQNGSKTKVWPSHLEIDYFGDGNMNEYWENSTSGHANVISGSIGPSGSSSHLEIDNRRVISKDGDGLPNYPHWGDTWEFYFKPTNFRNTPGIFRCNFHNNHYNTDDLYRIEWESDPTSGSDMSLEKRLNGSNVKIQATGDGLGIKTGITYRVTVEMRQSDYTIIVNWYDYDNNNHLRQLSLSDSSNPISGSAVSFFTNAYVVCQIGSVRILP
ncbi:hypothetical protein [Halocatena halophila]|uniref:hypothetical protein n=1 Tax=Halocatena halophila TaxID=2814576 RepID=UPI002ED1A040